MRLPVVRASLFAAFVGGVIACAAEADRGTDIDETTPPASSSSGSRVPASSSSTSSSGGGSSSGSTSGSSSGSTTPVCNTLPQGGIPVQAETSPEIAPVPAAGPTSDGTYVLTTTIVYTPAYPKGTVVLDIGSVTIVVTGSALEVVYTPPGNPETHADGTYSIAGTTITHAFTCGSPPPFTQQGPSEFTATATSLIYFTPTPIGMAVSTLVRQ